MALFKFEAPETKVSATVGGKLYSFYLLSPGALFRLRGLILPIVDVIVDFFSSFEKGARGQTIRDIRQADGATMSTTEIDPIDVNVANAAYAKRVNAIAKLSQALLDPATLREIYRLIASSMKSDFPNVSKMIDSQIDEAFEDFTIEMLFEALTAVGKANAKAFAPFMSSLKGAAREAVGKVAADLQSRMSQAIRPSPDGLSSSEPTPSGTPSPMD